MRTTGMLLGAVLVVGAAGAGAPEVKSSQEYFATPRAAADALLEACKNNDSAALVRMLGSQYGEELKRIDDAEERQHRRDFYEKGKTQLKVQQDGEAKAVLLVGVDLWPLPIPLVKEAAGWRFDSEAGLEEMLARRIGENELAVIDVCQEFPRFQADYAAIDRDGDQVREYAQRLASTPGARDGLYWEVDANSGERPSPLQAFLPDRFGDLRDYKPGTPFMGYHFRILTRQGVHPPGGKYDYVINGNMIAGFALVAWPADYRASGVMTFLVSHQGKLFEKDLGPDTAKLVEAIAEYDPDETWALVNSGAAQQPTKGEKEPAGR